MNFYLYIKIIILHNKIKLIVLKSESIGTKRF